MPTSSRHISRLFILGFADQRVGVDPVLVAYQPDVYSGSRIGDSLSLSLVHLHHGAAAIHADNQNT
jgi:hypothetical protein